MAKIMEPEERNRLNLHLAEYLIDRIGLELHPFRNFSCLNPGHQDSDPSAHYYPGTNNVFCFGCHKSYDLFDMIGFNENLTEYADQVKRARQLFGSGGETFSFSAKTKTTAASRAKPAAEAEIGEPQPDLSAEIVKFHQAIKEPGNAGGAYLAERGIGSDMINHFQLGYDASRNAIIIPSSGATHYVYRRIDEKKYRNNGHVQLFNRLALHTPEPVFITESAIDAMSIMELGYKAIALNGLNIKLLTDYMDRHRISAKMIISALDNDEKGAEGSNKLLAEMQARKWHTGRLNFPKSIKDTNEWLKCDRDAFLGALEQISDMETTETMKKDEKAPDPTPKPADQKPVQPECGDQNTLTPEQIEREKEQARAEIYLNSWIDQNNVDYFFTKRENGKPIETPFPQLNTYLGGGLKPFVHIIGAKPSVGKSTFCINIANHAALAGKFVVYLAFEQILPVIMAKSLSLYSRTANHDQPRKWLTTDHIEAYFELDALYKTTEKKAMEELREQYRADIQENLMIIDRTTHLDELFCNFVNAGRRMPDLLIVDFLQIMPTPRHIRNATAKLAVDANMELLKNISRDYRIPVLTPSSISRAKYDGRVCLAAFKESGDIESDGDILMGMNINQGRDTRTEMDIEILKNRMGAKDVSLELTFYPLNNYFEQK